MTASSLAIILTIKQEGLSALAYNPITLFSAYFGVIHFLTPIVKHTSQYYRYQNWYDNITLVSTALVTLSCYLLALIFSTKFNKINRARIASRHTQTANPKSLKNFSLFLFIIGAYFAYSDYSTLSNYIGIDVFLSDRHSAADARGSGQILANLMIVGFALYTSSIACAKKLSVKDIIILGCLLAFSFWYYSVITSRNSMLLTMLFGIVSYSGAQPLQQNRLSRQRKKTNWSLLIAATVLITSLVYILTVQRYSTSDSSYAQERLQNVGLYMLDGAFGNDEALLWMIENEHKIKYGATYLAAFTNIVPRRFWADKPLGGGPELINMISPGSYVIGAAGNNSLTTGLLTEAMMNFGLFGLPLTVISWSFFTAWLLRRALRSKSLASKTLLLIITASFSSSLLYSEFLGFLVRLGIYTLPVMLLIILYPRLGRITTNEQNK